MKNKSLFKNNKNDHLFEAKTSRNTIICCYTVTDETVSDTTLINLKERR
jgi:hypothetical protein